jgi:phage tail-like protein
MAGTARSQSDDPFSMNRFHVVDTEGYLNLSTPAAGFNTCVVPEINIEVAEYKEGIWTYRRKYPGETTFTPVTFTKGVVKNDTSMFRWIMAAAENRRYRSNIIIKHYHRDDVTGLIDYRNARPYREYQCFNVVPTRVKLGTDMDSMASDISIEEMDVELEYLRVFLNGTEVKPADL